MTFNLVAYLFIIFLFNGIKIDGKHERFRIGECTQSLIEDLRLDIISRITNFKRLDDNENNDANPLLATILRLVFHDCGGSNNETDPDGPGICNGCINIEDPDHAGLEFGAIYPLLQVYTNKRKILKGSVDFGNAGFAVDGTFKRNPSGTTWSDIMSLSDFWSISGTIAIEYSVYLSYITESASIVPNQQPNLESYGIPINYYYGRTDCSSAPFETTEYDFFNADAILWDFDDLASFFNKKFGFDDENTIAIMGAHKLGRGHPKKDISAIGKRNMYKDKNCCDGSGIPHRWNNPEDTFNNLYYASNINVQEIVEILGIGFPFTWIQLPGNETIADPTGYTNEPIWTLYINPGEPSILNDGLLLNVDMVLLYDINDNPDFNETGISNCKHVSDTFSPNKDKPVCKRNIKAKEEFDEYVSDNKAWLEAFMIAWDIMIQAGYNDLRVIKKDWETTGDDYEAILAQISNARNNIINNDNNVDVNTPKSIFNNIFKYYINHFDYRISLINTALLLLLFGIYKILKYRFHTKSDVSYAIIDTQTEASTSDAITDNQF